MVAILMVSAKLTSLGLLKIKVFWKKIYDVMIYFNDVNSKFLWGESNYVVDLTLWAKFGNSGISMREVLKL